MKAKEYAQRYLSEVEKDPSKENQVLKDTFFDFVGEIKQLTDTRHAKSIEAGAAIIKEIATKWYAFANIVNEAIKAKGEWMEPCEEGDRITTYKIVLIHPEGFLRQLEALAPETKTIVANMRTRQYMSRYADQDI